MGFTVCSIIDGNKWAHFQRKPTFNTSYLLFQNHLSKIFTVQSNRKGNGAVFNAQNGKEFLSILIHRESQKPQSFPVIQLFLISPLIIIENSKGYSFLKSFDGLLTLTTGVLFNLYIAFQNILKFIFKCSEVNLVMTLLTTSD